MKPALKDALTSVLALLARIATPLLARQLSQLSLRLLPNVPRLAGAWVLRFRDPQPSGHTRVIAVDAVLSQFGRSLSGTGHIQGQPGDPFEFHGSIKRNVVFGSFWRSNAHILAGTGTFVLKISADSRLLTGRCTWYDSLLDDAWSSQYVWTRRG